MAASLSSLGKRSCSVANMRSERPRALGEPVLVDRLACLRGEEVVAAAIGIEARWQAARGEHIRKPAKARGRAFLLHQKGRIDLARGVVHRHDQIEVGLPGKPGETAAIL